MCLPKIILISCLTIILLISNILAAEIAVIVNKESKITTITPQETAALFLGRKQSTRSMQVVTIIEQPRDSELRKDFFRLVNGMSLIQVNAYWSRLQFSGDIQPPIVLSNNQSVLRAVQNDIKAIGYIDSNFVDDSIRVALILKDHNEQLLGYVQ